MNREYYVDYIEKIASKVPMNPNDKFGPFIDVDYEPTTTKANNSRKGNGKNRPKDVNFTDIKTGKKTKGNQLKNKFKYMKEDMASFISNKKKSIGQGPMLNNAKGKMKNSAKYFNGKYPNAIGKGIGLLAAGAAAKSVYENKNGVAKLHSKDEEVNEMLRSGLNFRPRKYSPLNPNSINLGNRVLRDPIPGALTRDGRKAESKAYRKQKKIQNDKNKREMSINKMKHYAPVAATGAATAGLTINKYKNLTKGIISLDNAEAGKYFKKALRDSKLSKQLGVALPAMALASGVANYSKNKKLNAEHSMKYLENLTPEQRNMLSKKYGHMGKKKK